MHARQLGRTGLAVTPIGFGAFKIGRNQKIKYPTPYDLPDEADVAKLLGALLDIGIAYIDTAPAYGLSEERIGRALSHRRGEFVLSTKVGETFEGDESVYDYSAESIGNSIQRSCRRLQTDVLDLVFIHSNGDDLEILQQTDAVPALLELKRAGTVRAVGMSAKTVDGTRESLDWADAVMVEYHLEDQSHAAVIQEAAERGIGVIVKKGLAAGHLQPEEAIRFVLENPHVSALVIGGLNIEHIRSNVNVAAAMRS